MAKDEHSEERVAVLRQLLDGFHRHDADAVAALLTPDIVFDAAVGAEPHGRRFEGTDAVRAAFAAFWIDMPDVAWTVRRHMLAGDRATTEWLLSGTRADGMRVEVEGVDLFGFRGRLIARKSAFRKDRVAPKAA